MGFLWALGPQNRSDKAHPHYNLAEAHYRVKFEGPIRTKKRWRRHVGREE